MDHRFSINSIALGNIRRRRGRYLLLIVGIVLAIYFVATALLFADTMFTSLREQHYNRLGEQDAIVFNCGGAPLEELLSNGIFSEYGTAEILGCVLPDGKSRENSFSIARFGETALRLARKDLLEGRLPEKAGEITLERSVLAQLRTEAGVGDAITLTLMIPEGKGFLDAFVQKNYVLVGVLTDKLIYLNQHGIMPAYRDYPAGMVSAEEQIEAGGKAIINCYGCYGKDARISLKQLEMFCNENGMLNSDYPAWAAMPVQSTQFQLFGGEHKDPAIIVNSVFLIIIGLVLVLAACLGIVNAFSANLESRKQQIGLFRAVGATVKQIGNIFGREALILSLFSLPPAIGLACLTAWGITAAMGERYIFQPKAIVIVLVAAAGLLCVRFAASLPLNTAAGITPMQAIRNVELSRRSERGRMRSKKHFDVPRLIAYRNLTLYQNKKLGITAMLVVSIVLMSLVAAFATALINGPALDYGCDYALSHYRSTSDWLMEYQFHSPGITERDKADVTALSTVKRVSGLKSLSIKILTDRFTPYITTSGNNRFTYLSPEPLGTNRYSISPELHRQLAQQHLDYSESKVKYGYLQDYLTVNFHGIDIDNVENLSIFVSAGSIKPNRLSSGEEILIIAPAKYGLYECAHVSADGSPITDIDYLIDGDKTYSAVYQNDMFQVGDTLTVSMLYTDSPTSHQDGLRLYNDDGSHILPEETVRADKTVTIGALIEPEIKGQSLQDYFPFPLQTEVGDILTTIAGLDALGLDVPYKTLTITLTESPDTVMEEYLDINLSQIAARTPGADFVSHVATARELREKQYGLIIAVGALLLLSSVTCISMINNDLSSQIRGSRREIGTIRAVGATGWDISRSYLWQLISEFSWGTAIGTAAGLSLFALLLSTGSFPVKIYPALWLPPLFTALLFGFCCLNLRSKIKKIISGSIVENIREL